MSSTTTVEPSTVELELQPVRDIEASAAKPAGQQHEGVDREPGNSPIYKLVAAGFSFFCAGVNDGTLGPLIPYILSTFHIGTGEVAIIYATTFCGWFFAAVTNPLLTNHLTLGQLLGLGAGLQLLAQCLRPWSPFPLYCVTFFVQALGMAYQDSHANTFVSGLRNVPHRWLGFIHACYALGTFAGPLVATGIANQSSRRGADEGPVEGWRRVYFVLIATGAVNLAGTLGVFEDVWTRLRSGSTSSSSPQAAEEEEEEGDDNINNNNNNTATNNNKRNKSKMALKEMGGVLRMKVVWLISLFYFFELGASMTASGWVVEYLSTSRGGDLAQMGYVPAGYSGGMFLGRLLLAEPTFRFGEQRMLLVYSVLCAALQLVFWLQPNIIASATALSLMGFLFGPFFATGMSVASKLFPRVSQSTSLGFVFVLAQAGGALFPSITGLIATSAGVAVLQPIVLALIIAGGACWWLVPKIPERSE